VNRRRTVIIGEGAGQEPRPIIVEIADFVRQSVVGTNVVHTSMVDANMVDPEFRGQARRYGQRGQNGGGRKELYAGHLDSSGRCKKGRHFRPSPVPIQGGNTAKSEENLPQAGDFCPNRDA
jgi:hypothetical protein